MNHAPLRILTGAAALVLSVSLLTSAAVPVRSLPAASGEETVLARPSLQDPDTLARAVACQSLSYYRPELLDRYLAYGALWPELSPEDVVTRVNIGLDGTFYGDVSQAEEPESLSVLVNKYHPLPDGYVPRLHSLPARYALCELVNLHDASLEFEPIHRVVFGVEPERVVEELLSALPGAYRGEGDGHVLRFSHAGGKGAVTVPRPEAQLEVGTLQPFLDAYVQEPAGSIDYIHGADVARDLAARPGNIAFLLPAMGKEQLFPTVIRDGVLPRKTFSMGEAHDKRFYLEARKIR